jgi:hypothetical protein
MEINFERIRSKNDILISLSLLILGCGLMFLPNSVPINITGFIAILSGVILSFTLKTAYKDCVTGEIFSKKERYFAYEKLNQLMLSLTYPNRFCTNGENEGSTLRLDVYYNKNKVYIQLMEYVPYTYEPCTKFYVHDISNAAKFIYN